MGFYGNITNTSRTQFVFDRTYPNRWTMDQKCSTDGVYPGRYVLVEYETDFSKDVFKDTNYYFIDNKVYYNINIDGDGNFIGPDDRVLSETERKDIKNGDIIVIKPNHKISDINTEPIYVFIEDEQGNYSIANFRSYQSFWNSRTDKNEDRHIHIVNNKIINFDPERMEPGMFLQSPTGYSYNTNEEDSDPSYFMAKVEEDSISWEQIGTDVHNAYFGNSNTDRLKYGASRGYDSTVWQKVYQGGEEKYVMIAELNTVVPTFDIVAEAPSLIPLAPHFDADSTNVYYKFHWQPQWGIRTKAARKDLFGPLIHSSGETDSAKKIQLRDDGVIYPSDQETSWEGTFYNTKNDSKKNAYLNPESLEWEDEEFSFDAAIYYNKAGFDPEEVVYSEDIITAGTNSYDKEVADSQWVNEDIIGLSPSGKSGQSYSQHNNISDMSAQVDTQEFSFMLPSLGDSMAKIWDLIYGGRETNSSIERSSKRNLDIDWENAANVIKREGLRLIKNRPNNIGYFMDGGKEANTVAGAINSIHDLMGMIIVEDDENNSLTEDQVKQLNENNIYYTSNDGLFKRKHKTFDYTEVEYDYKNIDLDEDSYFKNFYYKDNTGSQIALDENIQNGQQYYQKGLSEESLSRLYKEISLKDVDADAIYYYKTSAGEYKREESATLSDGVNYLKLRDSVSGFQITEDYEAGTLFYKSGPDYILYNEESLDLNKHYVTLDEDNIELVFNNSDGKKHCLYIPGYFYTKTEDEKYTPIMGDFLQSNSVEGYSLKFTRKDDSSSTISYRIDEEGQLIPVVSSNIEGLEITPVVLHNFDENSSYYVLIDDKENPKTYKKIKDINTYKNYVDKELVKLPEGGGIPTYYIADTFYYQLPDKSFVKDRSEEKTEGREYFDLTDNDFISIGEDEFYIPNKYYIYNEDTEKYELSNSLEKNEGISYYKKDNLYVLEDLSGIYEKGTVWTTSMEAIPATIKLATRIDKYELLELKGFARELNTIHGLILKINQFMEFDDTETRDRSTVQGALNVLNDYIDRFKYLPSSRFIVTDSFGRLEGASHSTAQEYSTINWQNSHEENNEIAKTEDRFIDFELNSNPTNPYFTVKHKFTPVENTTTKADKNLGSFTETEKGNNDSTSDSLLLETPIVDNMGHIVGKNTEEVILPYSFKYFTANNNATIRESVNTVDNNKTIADSTKDTFNFEAYNKWIQLDTNTEDTMRLSHVYSGVNAGSYGLANSEEIDSLDSDNTFEVPYFTVDEAGHVTSATTNSVTLPENFSTIAITNSGESSIDFTSKVSADLVADTLADTVTVDAGNRWINLVADANNDKVSIVHAAAGEASVTTGQEADASPKFGESFSVLQTGVDQAGHVKSMETHTITLPTIGLTNGSGNIVTGVTMDNTSREVAITESKANVGTLALTGYIESNASTAPLAATDSINEAFQKTQAHLTSLDNTISDMDLENSVDNTKFITELTQTDGKIAYSTENINTTVTIGAGTNNTAPTVKVKVGGSESEAKSITIASPDAYGVTKLTSLTDSDSEAIAATPKAVKIAKDRADEAYSLADSKQSPKTTLAGYGITDAIKSDEQFNYSSSLEEDFDNRVKTIEWLFQKVASLEARIVELENNL